MAYVVMAFVLFLDLFYSLMRFHNKSHDKPCKPCANARESQYRQELLSRVVFAVDVLSCVDIFRQNYRIAKT